MTKNEEQLYLVVYNSNSGFAEIANVGTFKASSAMDAIESAKRVWNTTECIYAVPICELYDRWSYYI